MRLDWLADVLRGAGLTVLEHPGWKTRGRDGMRPRIVIGHHTASFPTTPDSVVTNLLVNGRVDLPGPLCHLGLNRDGAYIVIAAGKANHAGIGAWMDANESVEAIGIEAYNYGAGVPFPSREPWPQIQLDAYDRGVAALLSHLGRDERYFCFPAGTLVLTRSGLVPIELVEIGDEVYTHNDRFRRVTDKGSRWAETVRLRGHGHPDLIVTPDHPFLSPVVRKERVEGRPGHNYRTWHGFEWVEARAMVGRLWTTPTISQQAPTEFSPEELWIYGHWIAEGHIAKSGLQLTVHPREAQEVKRRAEAAGWHANITKHPTAAHVRIAVGRDKANWVRSEFGYLATGKRLPFWVYQLPEKHRLALLEGYLFGDGWKSPIGFWECNTVSYQLAVGLRLLAVSVGWAASLARKRTAGPGVIGGRDVQLHEAWSLRFRPYESSRAQGTFVDGYFVGRVRAVEASIQRQVFNLSVDEDESYLADGFVVHNCGHREWATPAGRKPDPSGIDLDAMRRRVGYLIQLEAIVNQLTESEIAFLKAMIAGVLSVQSNADSLKTLILDYRARVAAANG